MYSIVLLGTAVVSGGVSGYSYPDNAGAPYLCCPKVCSCCGAIIPYWQLGEAGPSLSEAEYQHWQAYLELLDEPERSEMADLFNKADVAAQRRLLSGIVELRAKTLTVRPEDLDSYKREKEAKEKDGDKDLSLRKPTTGRVITGSSGGTRLLAGR